MASRLSPLLYNMFAAFSRLKGSRKKFMNLGYEDAAAFHPDAEDEADAHHIALYMRLLDCVPGINETGSVLEVGCGRGGGCYVLKRYFKKENITGIDLSSGNIRIAKKLVPGVRFETGNAVSFSFPQKFDLVVNLESSHAYSSRKIFFGQVAAAMHEHSFFAFGDVMRKEKTGDVEQMLRESGLEIISSETVNEGVVRSLANRSGKTFPFSTRYPRLVPAALHNFFVTRHSDTFRMLSSGDVQYRLYLLKKKVG